jgi:hypothetical protein
MTTINKSKATIINRGLTSIIIVICFLFSLFQSQEAYAEKKRVTGTSKQIDSLVDTRTYYNEAEVRLVNTTGMLSSTDPNWDKAKSFSVLYYINPTGQGDEYKGCVAITFPNGDHAYTKFSGSWKWVLPRDGYRWTSEEIGRFTGGTGKFKGIKGTITIKGKGEGQNYEIGEWEAEYEISPTSN